MLEVAPTCRKYCIVISDTVLYTVDIICWNILALSYFEQWIHNVKILCHNSTIAKRQLFSTSLVVLKGNISCSTSIVLIYWWQHWVLLWPFLFPSFLFVGNRLFNRFVVDCAKISQTNSFSGIGFTPFHEKRDDVTTCFEYEIPLVNPSNRWPSQWIRKKSNIYNIQCRLFKNNSSWHNEQD